MRKMHEGYSLYALDEKIEFDRMTTLMGRVLL